MFPVLSLFLPVDSGYIGVHNYDPVDFVQEVGGVGDQNTSFIGELAFYKPE